MEEAPRMTHDRNRRTDMTAPMDLAGRTAIVTGSAKRIGRTIAMTLSAAGANVVINARSSVDATEATVQAIRDAGGRAVGCVADVTREQDAERIVRTALDAFGGVDILVNNAGIRQHDRLADISLAKWREVTSVILDGSFLCSRAAAPHLAKGGSGRIVNIGGTSAHRGARDRLHVMTAKAGLVGLTRGLALELAPLVTANCVVPGLIQDEEDGPEVVAARLKRMPTDAVPLQRTGRPQDVADLILHLCSDRGGYITGQTIHVNGGVFLC
jgi:3-oxoacyl-[acyl-carrier protein] reductase